MEPVFIEGFPKNSATIVAGEISEYEGRILAHIREMKMTLDGCPIRTAAGVAVPLPMMPAIRDAVRKLADVAAPNRIVAKLDIGHQQIWVGTKFFNDQILLDVRRYYNKGDQWLPGKGVSVRADLVDALIDLVERVAEKAAEVEAAK